MGAGKGRARRAQSIQGYTYPTINVREYVCENSECPSEGYVRIIPAKIEDPTCDDCDTLFTDTGVEYPSADIVDF